MNEKLIIYSLFYIPTEASNSYTAPPFYISGILQQQKFNRQMFIAKTKGKAYTTHGEHKPQLPFFGSGFCIVPHRLIALMTFSLCPKY